uniref:Uncharacterized protein n=1 Tax=Brassica campestris TaxID=3711 RepID=M4DMF7_BRACM
MRGFGRLRSRLEPPPPSSEVTPVASPASSPRKATPYLRTEEKPSPPSSEVTPIASPAPSPLRFRSTHRPLPILEPAFLLRFQAALFKNYDSHAIPSDSERFRFCFWFRSGNLSSTNDSVQRSYHRVRLHRLCVRKKRPPPLSSEVTPIASHAPSPRKATEEKPPPPSFEVTPIASPAPSPRKATPSLLTEETATSIVRGDSDRVTCAITASRHLHHHRVRLRRICVRKKLPPHLSEVTPIASPTPSPQLSPPSFEVTLVALPAPSPCKATPYLRTEETAASFVRGDSDRVTYAITAAVASVVRGDSDRVFVKYFLVLLCLFVGLLNQVFELDQPSYCLYVVVHG